MKRKTIEEIFSDGTKWKMSLQKQGMLNPNAGKPRDEETKQKISDSLKDYHSNISPVDNEDG